MEPKRTIATDYLESVVNREKNAINQFLAASAQKPAPPEKSEEQTNKNHLTESLRRSTGGR